MNAREVALHVVRDVFPSGGRERTAQESLDYRVRAAELDARDRAFATELAYGAIKMRRALDWYLQPFLGARAATIPPTTHEVLRLAMFELRYTRADAHATVYEFVEIAKRHGHRGLTGLVNAVLRSYLRDGVLEPSPERFADPDEYLGTVHSLPTWLVRQWRRTFGNERLVQICGGVNDPPQASITANRLRATPAAVAKHLAERGVSTRASALVPESLLVDAGGPVHGEPDDGAWRTQSESSAVCAEILRPQPGERVADLCSGRGNKALQIAGRMENEGELICVDRDERKIRTLLERFARCGASASAVVGDVRGDTLAGRFDRALLDAPCSGLGVVGRHPEARWKRHAGDGERLAPLQAELLEAAAPAIFEGGALVYAVCSTDPREGVEVVNGFLERRNFGRGLVPAQLEPFLTDDGDVLVPPGIGGRDGFYIARLERSL